jgi:putative ABC transport system permease protein
LVIAYQAVRRPFLRRLGLRSALRRPAETGLVIAGSLLGTAIITGSFIVGNTLNTSIRQFAFTQLGPIDEIIRVPDPAQAPGIESKIAALHDPRIDGVGSLVAIPASAASSASGSRRAEPQTQVVEANFDALESFGHDPPTTGLLGVTPAPGHSDISQDLADSLDAGVGDRVTLYMYGSSIDVTVDRVLPTVGIAGFSTGTSNSSLSPNAFVAPGTVADAISAGLPPGATPPQDLVIVSNRGGVTDGAAVSSGVTSAIERSLGPSSTLRVDEIKKDLLDAADQSGKQFSSLFLDIGAFAIVAGILLLVNIFVMLSEERKSQLGMLRAVGLRRVDLVRSFMIEGAIYALAAGALGGVLGIGVGWAIVKIAAPIFSGAGDFSLKLLFSMTAASVIGGACIGALISLVTVLVTSIRISRVNIIRAIRDLAEPRLAKMRRRTLVGGLALSLAAGAGFVSTFGNKDAFALAILGPPMVLFGLLPLGTRIIGRRTAVIAVALTSLVWGIFGNTVTGGQFFDGGNLFAFVLQGILLVFAAITLLSQSQETMEGGIRRIAAKRLSLRLALAYPLARRFRTGLTLIMYSLVIFTMTFIAVLSTVFGSQIDTATHDAGGGFNIYVSASGSNPPTVSDIASVAGVEHASPVLYGSVLYKPDSVTDPQPWPVSGITKDLVDVGAPTLTKRAAGFTSDARVWDKLIADPSTVVIDSFFLQKGGGGPGTVYAAPGDNLQVIDPITNKTSTRTVIGIVSYDPNFAGAYMSARSVRAAFGKQVSASRFYVSTAPNRETAVTTALQGRFVANGVEAKTFRRVVEDQQRISTQFLHLMQGYLALGLLVGIAGLGVVMIRAVRERRREIGVLRSLGFLSQQVRAAFLIESGFVAFEGIAVGSVLAIVTAAQLVSHGDFGKGIHFLIPWVQVLVLTGAAFVASLVATAWPARQASRIAPAVALRVAD